MRAVEDKSEIQAVQARVHAAEQAAAARGCLGQWQEFVAAAAEARAVICRPFPELERLAHTDSEAISTYYKLLHAGARLPSGDQWERLRHEADTALFREYRDEIRFGALSLDGKGVANYGEVSMVCANHMIAHRATVFETNSALFFRDQRAQGNEPPNLAGYRARWSERGKLAGAKCAPLIDAHTTWTGWPEILLKNSPDAEKDEFVEVHIYGSLTRRSLDRVSIDSAGLPGNQVAKIKDRLETVGVEVEVI